MKKIPIVIIIFTVSITTLMAQGNLKLLRKDLKPLVGDWTGTLTYLDYSSNKPYTMPADISIRQIGNSNSFAFSKLYPDEPKANSNDTIRISANGQMLDNTVVKSKTKLANGALEIVTEYTGADGNDNKPATIRTTYTIGKKEYKSVKEIQFAGDDKWIKRHEYRYTRK